MPAIVQIMHVQPPGRTQLYTIPPFPVSFSQIGIVQANRIGGAVCVQNPVRIRLCVLGPGAEPGPALDDLLALGTAEPPDHGRHELPDFGGVADLAVAVVMAGPFGDPAAGVSGNVKSGTRDRRRGRAAHHKGFLYCAWNALMYAINSSAFVP